MAAVHRMDSLSEDLRESFISALKILCPGIHVIMFELNDAELYSGQEPEMN